MLESELYEQILMRYARMGRGELRIVSGYASPEMCTRLILDADRVGGHVDIDLIVGMVGAEGIDASSHRAFMDIRGPSVGPAGSLRVRYSKSGLGVHSKVFVWTREGEAVGAWMGSANFTQMGFGIGGNRLSRREVMTPIDPAVGIAYCDRIALVSIPIEDASVRVRTGHPTRWSTGHGSTQLGDNDLRDSGVEATILPLVALQSNSQSGTTRGGVHARAGLNWGQRPEYAREPNQAYIPVPSRVQNSEFFPSSGIVFRVVADDGVILLMTRAQAHGKALPTPQDNSLIGRYFRSRLGVPDGGPVTTDDLTRYGSRFVRFAKENSPEGELVYRLIYKPELEAPGALFYGI